MTTTTNNPQTFADRFAPEWDLCPWTANLDPADDAADGDEGQGHARAAEAAWRNAWH